MRSGRFRPASDPRPEPPFRAATFLQQLASGRGYGLSSLYRTVRTIRTILGTGYDYGRPERQLLRSVLRQHNTQHLSCGEKGRARISSEGKDRGQWPRLLTE